MALRAAMDGFFEDFKSFATNNSLSPARSPTRHGEPKKDDNDKMKTKFLEAWNNFRYDLVSGTNIKKDSPLWLLGMCYHSKEEKDSSEDELSDSIKKSVHIKAFLMDFFSRPWFSYRKQFPPLPGTIITSDTGWGCMLRSAQMMLAQGLMMHFLGRDWRIKSQDRRDRHIHQKIMGWFVDDIECPFSIHQLTWIGRKLGNKPGDWYGPNTVAYILQEAVKHAEAHCQELKEISVYVAQDCTIYSEDVYNVCGWNEAAHPTLEESKNSSDQEEFQGCGVSNSVFLPDIIQVKLHESTPSTSSASLQSLDEEMIRDPEKSEFASMHENFKNALQNCRSPTRPDTQHLSASEEGEITELDRCSNLSNSYFHISETDFDSPKISPVRTNFATAHQTAAIILLPVRLGESVINPIYIPCIQEMLTLQHTLGIIGGKPKHSLHFVGFQEESLLHLDPHYCQVADTLYTYKKNLHNYHATSVRKINMKKVDPSCCFGFYCRNAEDYGNFKQEAINSITPSEQHMKYPMCQILDGSAHDHHVLVKKEPEPDEIDEMVILDNYIGSNIPNHSGLSLDVVESTSKIDKARKISPETSRFSKLLPSSNFYPKFMRQKSSSPAVRRKHKHSEESFVHEFELLDP